MVTVSVYVIVLPGATAETDATCVIERSAPETTTEAVAVLLAGFGSVPVSLTVTEFVMVDPAVVSGFTETTTLKIDEAPPLKLPVAVHVIAPVPPTAGFVPHVHPVGGVTDTKRVPGGVF